MHVNLIYVFASMIFVTWETHYFGNNWEPASVEELYADYLSMFLLLLAFYI